MSDIYQKEDTEERQRKNAETAKLFLPDSGLKEAASDNVKATGQNTLRCFLDTEFIEAGRHSPVQLISIGIVTEDGREFYAESQEFDPKSVSPWLKENVLPHLGPVENRKPVALIAREVREFIGDASPEFWGYYADYDWVVFCQMFGSMIDLPEGWPMYCRDIKQLCDSLGNPKLPPNDGAEHNALSDAKWNEKALQFLLSEHGGQPESASGVSSPTPSVPASVEHVEQEEEKQALEEKETNVNAGDVSTQNALQELIRHCWIHSNYRNCGFVQMTSAQKELYGSIIGHHEDSDWWNELKAPSVPSGTENQPTPQVSPNPVPSPSSIVEQEKKKKLSQRITNYLCSGGLFNPEMAIHDNVRDLLFEIRDCLNASIERAVKQK